MKSALLPLLALLVMAGCQAKPGGGVTWDLSKEIVAPRGPLDITASFPFRNESAQTIRILKIVVCCASSMAAFGVPTEVPPGQTGQILIQVRKSEHSHPLLLTADVTSSDAAKNPKRLSLLIRCAQ